MARPEWDLIEATLTKYLQDPKLLSEAECRIREELGEIPLSRLEAILTDAPLSYRDVTLVQLAYALNTTGLDTAQRPEGARSIGGKLGEFLALHHVRSVADAYQNVGKNSANLVRGNVAYFDEFLTWAATASHDQLLACFEYTCARIAALARPVKPLPEINVARLTFAAMMALYNQLLASGSQGAYEQYITDSLLYALVEQHGMPNYRVKTKGLNASDKSSKTAGDIEILTGSTVLEAYEVTANDWRTKLTGVGQKLREYDLARIHIVAPLDTSAYGDVARELANYQEDISVLDLRGFIASLVSGLRRTYRNVAIERLYRDLDQHAGVQWVNQLVDTLVDQKLVTEVGE